MGILTNFLKLLKPEENDYYNAITEQAENWQKVDDWAKGIDDSNKKKLDAGAVSAEYNTGKKIEDKIKAVQTIAGNKLDKGSYTGNAQSLKDEIDKKQNITDSELQSDSKEIVGAINESLWRIKYNEFGSTTVNTDIFKWASTVFTGFFSSVNNDNLFTNLPSLFDGNVAKLFTVEVKDFQVGTGGHYRRLILYPYGSTKIFVASGLSYLGNWSEWEEVITNHNQFFLGNSGIDKVTHIQDNIIKEENKGYIDKPTGKLYRCIKQAPVGITTPNAEYFVPADNISNSKSLTKKQIYYSYSNDTPSTITLNENYTNFDYLEIYVSLDGYNSNIADQKHSALMPIDKSLDRQAISINQWGVASANSIELSFFKNNPTNVLIDKDGHAGAAIPVFKIIGVKIGG